MQWEDENDLCDRQALAIARGIRCSNIASVATIPYAYSKHCQQVSTLAWEIYVQRSCRVAA